MLLLLGRIRRGYRRITGGIMGLLYKVRLGCLGRMRRSYRSVTGGIMGLLY
jgi:hypothetical protein